MQGVRALVLSARGADPDEALADVDRLPPGPRLTALAAICEPQDTAPLFGLGPRYRARADALRPTPALMRAVVDRGDPLLRRELNVRPSHGALDDVVDRFPNVGRLDGCRRALGMADFYPAPPAAERAEDFPLQRLNAQVLSLLGKGRFDQALAVSRVARVGPPPEGAVPLWSGVAWLTLQQTRLEVLAVADLEGREDVAGAAAETILADAVSPDRVEYRAAGAAVPRALSWVVAHRDRATALAWTERLDAAVRPGQRGWVYADALAVHRAWLALRRPDRAQALQAAVLAAADATPAALPAMLGEMRAGGQIRGDLGPDAVRQTAAEMAAAGGQCDAWQAMRGRRAADLFRIDLFAGVPDLTLDDRLARAVSADDRQAVLRLCLEAPQFWSMLDLEDAWAPPPLALQADCARRATEAPAASPGGPSTSGEDPRLTIAERALRRDRLDIALDLVRAWLAAHRTPDPADPSQRWFDASVLIEVAAADLDARGQGRR